VRETVIGDLREMYRGKLSVAAGGHDRRATLWYWSQVLLVGGRYLARRIVYRRPVVIAGAASSEPAKRRARHSYLSDIGSDARFAVRSFRRAPGFALAAVLVLGIGIGAVSLMFSTFNSVVLRPLPFPEPERLVWVWGTTQAMPRNTISYADYIDYRDGTDAFESLAATMFPRTRVLTGDEGAERVFTYPVSANLFPTLGVPPVLGRAFLTQDEQTGTDGLAILSHGFWQRRFGGDAAVIGSTITLDGLPAEVVGVMPRGFDYPSGTDVWFPLQRGAGYTRGRSNNNFSMLGRLRDVVSIEQAQAQMEVVARNISQSFPEVKRGSTVTLVPLHERFFGSARDALLLLAGIISLVPLVACANVASLFVARAVGRRTELASRLALGASRQRLVRQLVTEGVVVALVSGALGLGIAYAGGEALRYFAPQVLPRMDTIAVDVTVVSITLGAALLMVPLFALVPAIRATDLRIAEELRLGGARGPSRAGSRFRSIMVVTQVALSLMLLLASGLLLRSFVNLQHVDSGLRTEGVLSINALLPDFKYTSRADNEQLWSAVQRRVQAVPGVRTVGLVDNLPFGFGGPRYYVWAAERPPASAAERVAATRRGATRGYFDGLGIQLLAGRHFEEMERWFGSGAPGTTVINQTLAWQFFPGEDPLGKTLVLEWNRPVELEVIGVMADVRELGPGTDPLATFYLPLRWDYDMLSLLLVTSGDPLAVVGAVRQAIGEVDADITLSAIQTMQDRLSGTLFQPRFRTALVAVFALVTLILSSIGLYGVLAYFVRERSHEISVRLALGAGVGRVAGLVLTRGLALVAGGIAIGYVGALAATRLIESVLFGVGATDPITFGTVSVCLVIVALIACVVPTLRAVRLDPAQVMRAE